MEKAIVHTSKGNMTVEFFPDDAPKTVENFLMLARS
ncbi:MAG: peptidylprolyl isomerase, partial [Bacteroidota bacterium]